MTYTNRELKEMAMEHYKSTRKKNDRFGGWAISVSQESTQLIVFYVTDKKRSESIAL